MHINHLSIIMLLAIFYIWLNIAIWSRTDIYGAKCSRNPIHWVHDILTPLERAK